MQDNFHGIDISVADHVSKATNWTRREITHSTHRKVRNISINTDIDIQSNSALWSDDEQDIHNHHREEIKSRKINPNQRKLSRYVSTVNRSLLDCPSNLIADFYLSQLNRNMQEDVHQMETVSHDKAHKQEYYHNNNKNKTRLNRSLSVEHLYQVRQEHLRYKQPLKIPTSFTNEDVTDIYKPFVLENYKRKIAIELERRRRERQERSTSDNTYSSTYDKELDLSHKIIKATHPPIVNLHHHCQSNRDFPVRSPSNIVQTKETIMGRARRILFEDGCTDVHHRVDIILPPLSLSQVDQSSLKNRVNLTATIHTQHAIPYVKTVDKLDFIDRKQMSIQQELEYNDGIIDGVLTSSKQVFLIKI